jgi:metal-responsive CopG/Arc/MetJ family transcriptional regulator
MAKQTVLAKNRCGPVPTGKGTQVVVRMHADLLEPLDEWIQKQRDRRSRPEAIRQILERALKP